MKTFYLKDLECGGIQQGEVPSTMSLRGNQDKWQYKKENIIIKADLDDGFRKWEDWKVEAIAGELLPVFDIEVVKQGTCKIDDGYGYYRYGSYSVDFRRPRERYLTFHRLLEGKGLTDRYTDMSGAEKIEIVISVLSEYLGKQRAAGFAEDMCLADYILGNVDRHSDNFGVLIRRDEDGNAVEARPVPLYDFGMGLFQSHKEGLGNDFEEAKRTMLLSPFAINVFESFTYFKKNWQERCKGMKADLSRYDFPKGLGKQYLQYTMSALGVKTER